MGTIVLSTNPPRFQHHPAEGPYSDSSAASQSRVRFNEDGTPRGVLKNGHQTYSYT